MSSLVHIHRAVDKSRLAYRLITHLIMHLQKFYKKCFTIQIQTQKKKEKKTANMSK